MFADFFIKRPVFSSVCALIIVLLGAICIPLLPIAQYPEVAPPQVVITANYTGATAEVVENTVTTVLEREINGAEGLRYITSSSTSTGTSTITATFEAGRDDDLAAVDVQNRVSVAEPQLPEAVQRTGVSVTRQNSGFLLALGVYAENGEYDSLFMSNYVDRYVVDSLKRVKGVGNVQIFGRRQYAMRLWLDLNRLTARGLTPQDVVNAVSTQNLQIGAGRLGQQPSPDDLAYQIDLEAKSRFTDVNQFLELVLRAETDGTLIKLKDVGRAELGAEDYSSISRFRGRDAIGLGISQLPGSNALQTARAVEAEMKRLSQSFPPGMTFQDAFDTTLFVQASMEEAVMTLFVAIGLVILIIYAFLQDWRTTLIPSLTIPASLIGTFAFMLVFGFSINSLTLFGLILATGLVVDDAIIVVEQISRLIQEEHMSPLDAAIEGMRELSSAIIATSLVLMAVFVPVAFFPGVTGILYRQFALTIAFSIALSTFLALTLTPALAALLLRPGQRPPRWLNWFFRRFNRFQEGLRSRYERSLNRLVRVRSIVIGLFVLSLGLTALLYLRVPTGFLPEEDQGYFITIIQAPEGVSLNYTDKVVRQVEQKLLAQSEVKATFAIVGFGFSGNAVNTAIVFSPLKPWSERKQAAQSAQSLAGRLTGEFSQISEARIISVNPPAIRGLGNFSGFTFQLQDRRISDDLNALVQTYGQLVGQANQTPGLQRVFSTFAANAPKLQIEFRRDIAEARQVKLEDVFNTLQTAIGSRYVNDFTLEQRNYRVYVQADQQFRSKPEDIRQLYVRSARNDMVPLSDLVNITPTTGPQNINHYNLYRAIEITGNPAPGFSSGDALTKMEAVAAEALPPGLGYEWSGLSLDEKQSGGQSVLIFGLGLVLVFLVLAAQYENYVDPLIIMLAVPLAILGALSFQSLRGLSNDVYCQVGLVMLIGLASKNSILIVEFANQLRSQGKSIAQAAVQASEQRLRPIVMTAISSLMGFFPLVIASGAGAGSRQSLGTAVFGGLLVSTFLSLFITPILFIVIISFSERVRDRFRPHKPTEAPAKVEGREPVHRG
jgi:HAE1 family hydrophobic/amphiphilic exporter-1